MISAVHAGSLGFDCLLASRSATNEENILIHYYQIQRNWRVIELPLRRWRRNPKESYRAIITTRESDFNSESSGIADTREDFWFLAYSNVATKLSILACSCALQRCRLVVSHGAHGRLIEWIVGRIHRKGDGYVWGASWTVSIGAVIRAPTLRAFPLITELSNIPQISDTASETRLSELMEFWDSEMARIGAEGWENGTLQANQGVMWSRTR